MKIIIEGNTGDELRKQILSLAEQYSQTPNKQDRDSVLIMELQEEIQFLKARINQLTHHQQPVAEEDMHDDDVDDDEEIPLLNRNLFYRGSPKASLKDNSKNSPKKIKKKKVHFEKNGKYGSTSFMNRVSEAEKIKMEEITMDNFLEHLNKKQHI